MILNILVSFTEGFISSSFTFLVKKTIALELSENCSILLKVQLLCTEIFHVPSTFSNSFISPKPTKKNIFDSKNLLNINASNAIG